MIVKGGGQGGDKSKNVEKSYDKCHFLKNRLFFGVFPPKNRFYCQKTVYLIKNSAAGKKFFEL